MVIGTMKNSSMRFCDGHPLTSQRASALGILRWPPSELGKLVEETEEAEGLVVGIDDEECMWNN